MNDPVPTDVGAAVSDGKLRLWKAKEAVRQGELRLAAQATARTALEARATALTGWAAAGLLALVGGAAATTDRLAWAAAAIAGTPLFASAAVGVYAGSPRVWSLAGYNPQQIAQDALPTELEVLESSAKGILPKIDRNEFNLTDISRQLLLAGWLLILTPILGISAYALLHAQHTPAIKTGLAYLPSAVAQAAGDTGLP